LIFIFSGPRQVTFNAVSKRIVTLVSWLSQCSVSVYQ
jgi:hypothetical protein